MEGLFSIGDTQVAFCVKQTARAKHLRLLASKEGVTVALPAAHAAMSEVEVLELLHSKREWILRSVEGLAARDALHTPKLERFRGGAKVVFLGHPRLLKLVRGERNRVVNVETHAITVEVAGVPFLPETELAVKELLQDWKREETERITDELASRFAQNLGLPPPPTRAMQSAQYWGLCETNGTLKFDWRLVELEPRQIESIVAHEVAHLVERNHGAGFREVLAQVLNGAARLGCKLENMSKPFLRSPEK